MFRTSTKKQVVGHISSPIQMMDKRKCKQHVHNARLNKFNCSNENLYEHCRSDPYCAWLGDLSDRCLH